VGEEILFLSGEDEFGGFSMWIAKECEV